MPLRAIYLTLHPPTPSTQLLVGSFLIVPDECCLENKLYLRRKLSPQLAIQTTRSGCWMLGVCLDELMFNFTVVAFQTDTMKPRQELAIFFIFLLSTSALARDLPAKHRQTQLQQVRNQLL